MTTLAIVVALTLLISAFCSLLEAALYSTRVATLEAAVKVPARRAAAKRFLEMKHDVGVPTSAILILNTIANTAGATIAGMYAASALGPAYVVPFSVVLTLAILFFSEILPKTYGATHWRAIWWIIVWPLTLIEKVLFPLIRITQKFTKLFTPKDANQVVTADEIHAMVHVGAKVGELTAAELRMLDAVFHFDKLLCRQVMVPRSETVFVDVNGAPAEWLAEAKRSQHSRYPVCRDSLDEVVGILAVRDLIGLGPDELANVDALLRPVNHVPETKRIHEVLVDMQRSRQHMAIVVDEHGGSAGIITLENILEKVVGSIEDEFDAETPNIAVDKSGHYIARGATPLEEINRDLRVDLHAPNVNTLSGFLVAEVGRFPKVGDSIDLPGLTAEVLQVEDNRATKIRLRRRTEPSPAVEEKKKPE